MDFDIRQSTEGRRSIEYRQWRRSVFERDNYTCQNCGAIGVRLNAHHKKPYAYYPDLRYSKENGITLCVPCHKAVHRRKHDVD
jgi:5-methylcytosine-specific restriction endonuclease McrA